MAPSIMPKLNLSKDTFKSVATNPSALLIGIGTALTALSGAKESKKGIAAALEAEIDAARVNSREFINLKDLISGEVSSAAELVQKAKSNPKLLSVIAPYLNDFDMEYHPQSKILELTPTRDYLIKKFNIDSPSAKDMRRIKLEGAARHALPALVGTGLMALGPVVYDKIKSAIANNDSTKKVASLLKEELEKRAEDASLQQITQASNIDDILIRCANNYNDSWRK